MENRPGIMLTDERFFGELIDPSLRGLEGIPAAAAAGDYALCRKLFAAHVRETLEPEKFFTTPYETGDNEFTFPGESEEEAVERIARHCLISVGVPHQFGDVVDWFANPTYNQYKEWTWQLSRHHEWKVLAHQYRLTGDERHAAAFAELFSSWVRQAGVPGDDVPGCETLCWRTIECGIRMGASWPYALFAFYRSPHFTDDLLVDWYKSVWEHGNRMRLNHWKNNWLIMEMNGLAQIGILYPQFRASREWLDYAVSTLTQELDNQVYEDGFQFELSDNYHYVVIINYFRLLYVAKAFGVQLPQEMLQKLEKMMNVFVQLMQPTGETPDLNDGKHRAASCYLSGHLSLFPENRTFRWVCAGRQGAGEPAYTSVALEYSGMAVMRSGWGKNDVWGFLDAGPYGAAHQHEDKLNLLICANGKEILTECGNYAYDSSAMRVYALSTRSHNTVRVNGMDQNRGASYKWRPEDIHRKAGMVWRSKKDFDYARGTYSEGYGASCTDVQHQRSVLFFKKDQPFFVVIDRLLSSDENEYELLWHVDAEEVTLRGMNAKADFLHILSSMELGKRDSISIVCCQQQPEWQGWKKGPTEVQGDDAPLPTVRCLTHGASVRLVTVLYPADNCPIAAVEADRDVSSTAFTLVMKDGTRISHDEKDYQPR